MTRFIVALALSCSIGAYADTVTAPGSSWFPNSGPTASNVGTGTSGTAFWDNPSNDGAKCNVGYYLAGTNTCAPVIPGAPGNLQYLAATGSGGSTAASAMTFTSGGSTVTSRPLLPALARAAAISLTSLGGMTARPTNFSQLELPPWAPLLTSLRLAYSSIT